MFSEKVTETTIDDGIRSLKNGELIILMDDMVKNMSFLMGLAKYVTPECINTMTKIGKGLTYVCITESKTKQLKLPLMIKGKTSFQDRDFTVAVDHKSSTTGISAFERAHTIKAFTDPDITPDDFLRPGHVFPLVGKDGGLVQRIDIVEASIDLSKICSEVPISYLCEVLNDYGEIATEAEVKRIARTYGFDVVKISDILRTKKNQFLHSLSAKVIKGNQIGRKIGFPTANLDFSNKNIQLNRGVYGVKVQYDQMEYLGMMSVGLRPTFHKYEKLPHFEVNIFDFDKDIYGDTLKVDICFFIREEISFPTVDDLVTQIHKDKEVTLKRFKFLQT